MSAHASGASNGSTSSFPFFGTQNSSLFGTAVGNSNGASGASNGFTSAPSVFANQNSNPFGITAVGSSSGFSSASNGPTFGSSLFQSQNSNLFGTAVGNSNGAFGGSNGSTSAPPFFGNQSLNPFGFGTVQYSAGNNTSPFVQSSSSYPRFGEGATTVSPFCSSGSVAAFGSTTVSPFCSSGNAASFASCGCTSASPFIANQSTGPFGTSVATNAGLFGQSSSRFTGFGSASTVSPVCSSGNATFCGGCTSTSPFFANQSSGPFGTSVATSAGPFGQSSSRFTEFGNRTNASTSGQTSSSFGGFGEAATSTTPLFGHPGPSLNTFRGASFTTPVSTLQTSSFPLGGRGPATADNSCGGTRRAPYQPTPAEEDNPSCKNHSLVLTSISAMNCYCNKSHEELRLEEYKQTRNRGPFSAAHVPEVSSPLPSLFSWLPPPCEPLASTLNRSPEYLSQWGGPSSAAPVPGVSNPLLNTFSLSTFNRSSEIPIQRTDPSSSLGSDKNRTTSVQSSVAQTLPVPTPTTTTTMSNRTLNVNLNDMTLSITASGGASFIPSFVNCIIPAFGASGSNGWPLNSELGTPVLGFPILIPTTLAFTPQYPQVSNPTSALPLLQPETRSNPRTLLLNPTSSASTSNPANAHLGTFAVTSHVSPSAGVFGEQITNLSTSAPPAPTNDAPSGRASPLEVNLPPTQYSSSIPKGLEIIVEHLGFNPWEEGKRLLQDSQVGQILLCEDASDDADILSLAEFAVEQHNAMEQFRNRQPWQDDKWELLKVTAACLETVDGGRYHIVLEAKKVGSSKIPVYAVVLRKKTDRPTPLIVLERWLFNSLFDLTPAF